MKLENGTFMFSVHSLWEHRCKSTSVEMSWFSLGLKNTDVSVKFFFAYWYRASAVKIGCLDDAWRLACAACLFKLSSIPPHGPFLCAYIYIYIILLSCIL